MVNIRTCFILFLSCFCCIGAIAQPKVIAHRGYWTTDGSAQNSLASFTKADSIGCYGSEIDVYLTADDVLIVNHDPVCKDTGISMEKDSCSKVCSIVLPNGENVPRLDAYLELVASKPQTRLILEMKSLSDYNREDLSAKEIIRLLGEYDLMERTDIIAFSINACMAFRKLAPELPVYYLNGDLPPKSIKKLGLKGIDYSVNKLKRNPEWVSKAHELGLEVNVWTVNTEEDMRHFIGLGVDYITTDYPELLMSVLEETSSAATEKSSAEPLIVKLFPDGAPTKTGLEGKPEEINKSGNICYVNDPELLVYLPDPTVATGQAMLVVPGGSYSKVCVPREGYKTVEMLNRNGIAAILLKYRSPNGHPEVPLEDGEQAMRIIRRNAKEWGINPQSVGVIGFSAGGHFVSTLITEYGSAETRPDFAVLVYPVISMQYSNAKTRENLLGERSGSKSLRKRYSTFENVHEDMPEVMLVLCDDDEKVIPNNSILFYKAMKKHDVKGELHIFPEGGHGFWMRERYQYGEETYPAVIRWIQKHNSL